MTERLPQIHNSDSEESRQCYTQPGQHPRPKLFDFGNLSPESQAIYDASRAGSRFDHLIDHALLLARIRGDKEQLVYASEPDDTLPAPLSWTLSRTGAGTKPEALSAHM